MSRSEAGNPPTRGNPLNQVCYPRGKRRFGNLGTNPAPSASLSTRSVTNACPTRAGTLFLSLPGIDIHGPRAIESITRANTQFAHGALGHAQMEPQSPSRIKRTIRHWQRNQLIPPPRKSHTDRALVTRPGSVVRRPDDP